jgi:hypothetical protein
MGPDNHVNTIKNYIPVFNSIFDSIFDPIFDPFPKLRLVRTPPPCTEANDIVLDRSLLCPRDA